MRDRITFHGSPILLTRRYDESNNYVVTKLSGQPSDVKRALDTVDRAVAELGLTSRHAMDALERIAEYQRPAVRVLVAPVGKSCATLEIGRREDGAIPIDVAVRAAIDAPEVVEITPTQAYDIFISELDHKNRTCKFSLREDQDHRINGEISDPIIQAARNPYSEAFAAQQWLVVMAKAQIKDGEIEKLFISDVPSSKLLTG